MQAALRKPVTSLLARGARAPRGVQRGPRGSRCLSSAAGAAVQPFHYAFPTHDLQASKDFYGGIMGCAEGRSSTHWQDYNLYGHQIVCHYVGDDYRAVDYINPVDDMEVPVPHAGIVLTEEQFHGLAQRLRDAGVSFVIEPQLRFKGKKGEQYTCFFKDPSGNNLEFKAMTRPENLFNREGIYD